MDRKLERIQRHNAKARELETAPHLQAQTPPQPADHGSETPSIPGNRPNHPSVAVSQESSQEIAQVPSHDQHQIGHHASGKP